MRVAGAWDWLDNREALRARSAVGRRIAPPALKEDKIQPQLGYAGPKFGTNCISRVAVT